MPDYEFNGARVKVTITGMILDADYARVLARKPDLNLLEITMLNKLQNGQQLTTDAIKHLRRKGLDDSCLKLLIVEHIRSFGLTPRSVIDRLLNEKLSRPYSDEQWKDQKFVGKPAKRRSH